MTENTASEAIPASDASANTGEQGIARRKRRRRLKGADYKHKKHGARAEQVGDIEASADGGGSDDFASESDDNSEVLVSNSDAVSGDQQGNDGGRTGRRRKRNRRKKGKQHSGGEQQSRPQQSQPQQQPRNDTPQPKFNEQARFFGRKQSNGGGFQGGPNGNRRDRRGRRGPNGFVGPMDHTYRGDDNMAQSTVGQNGNFRQQPQRPQNFNVNGNIASYADSITVPVREDAPTRVYCFIEDLFFHAKIRETAKMVGVKVEFLKNDKEQIERMLAIATVTPVLVVVDLNNMAAKPLPLVKKLRPKLSKGSSLIGFVQHVQGELKMEAQEAGCDVVMPRSAFSSNLPNILRRFTEDEQDEPNFNSDGALTF